MNGNRNREPTVLVALPGERILVVVVMELSSLKVVEAFRDEKGGKRSKIWGEIHVLSLTVSISKVDEIEML